MFFLFVQALRLQTQITQTQKLTIIDGTLVHPWFTGNQTFVDWENNKIRQYQAINENSYPINVTFEIFQKQQKMFPFIQESIQSYQQSDIIKFTLFPNQHFKFAVEYNCSDIDQTPLKIIVKEQTFKNNQQDQLNIFDLTILKVCKQTHEYINIKSTLILIGVFIIILLSSIFNIMFQNSKFNTQFTYRKQMIFMTIIPLILKLVKVQFILFDFLRQIGAQFTSTQRTVFSIILTIITIDYHYYQESAIISLLLFFVSITLITRRIIISTYKELFIYMGIVWIYEISWLAHYHAVDKHCLVDDQQQLFFYTELKLSDTEQSLNEKYIEIQFYQVIAVSLVYSFFIRNGLFNKEHIYQIIIISISQLFGLLFYDILFRYKMNPPFITLVTGFMLLGISMNQLIFKKGLKSAFIKFKDFDDIKLKVTQ